MKNWEEERLVCEDEMTPQQKEAAVKAANERMEREYERGRKTIFVMMVVEVAMSALVMFSNVYVAEAGRKGGYVTLGLFNLGCALVIAYNLYHGKTWARILFAILLGFSILQLLGVIFRLDIGRTDYSKTSSNTWVYSDGRMVRSWELGKAELAQMQEQEDARATIHRTMMALSIFFLAVRAAYFYLLFFYHPVREFLYGQNTNP